MRIQYAKPRTIRGLSKPKTPTSETTDSTRSSILKAIEGPKKTRTNISDTLQPQIEFTQGKKQYIRDLLHAFQGKNPSIPYILNTLKKFTPEQLENLLPSHPTIQDGVDELKKKFPEFKDQIAKYLKPDDKTADEKPKIVELDEEQEEQRNNVIRLISSYKIKEAKCKLPRDPNVLYTILSSGNFQTIASKIKNNCENLGNKDSVIMLEDHFILKEDTAPIE